MYIESAELSFRHASIKYTDLSYLYGVDEGQGVYTLSDCSSDTGTWVKLKQTYTELQNGKLLELHSALSQQFWVGQHRFVI